MKNQTLRSSISSPRFLRLKVTLLLAALLLLTATWSGAQSLTNSLRIENTLTSLQLHYSLANSNGAFFFLQSDQLNNLLGAGQVIASGIAASNTVGTIGVPLPTNTASFFALLHDPTLSVSPEDFTSIDDGDVPEAPVNLLIESPNLPDVLTTNSPFPLTLNITDINGNLVSTNGHIALSLENGDGTPVTFAYTLSPATVGVTNGIGQTVLTIQSTNSLAEVFLVGKFTGQLAGASLRNANDGTPIVSAGVTYANYSDPDTINWRYPLLDVVPLSAAFGEWPGHSDIHYGIDFSVGAGKSVLAAKKGVVVKIGLPKADGSQGQYVAIYHGNGYVTRYLHITPNVIPGRIVTSGQVIGTVYNWAHRHLHFEMLQLNNPAAYNSDMGYRNLYLINYDDSLAHFPGVAINPIGNPSFKFSSTLFTSGGQVPRVKSIFFRASHPALTPLLMDPANACKERLFDSPPPAPVYVVLQVVEETAGGVLPPRQITFIPDNEPGPTHQRITYGLTATDIKKLDPRGWTPANGPGYALLTDLESNSKTAISFRTWRYKYWFTWDTSQYTDSPHSFTVQAVDLAGNAADPVVFTFGPKIIGVGPTQLPGQYVFTTMAYLGTLGTSSLPALTQPDRYKMEIIQTNGTALPGVLWDSPILNGLTPPLTTHLQANSYTFTLPANTIPDGLKLRVSSRLAMNIAHQVEFCCACSSVHLPSPCAPGYTAGIILSSPSKWTWTCTGSDGVPVSCSQINIPGYGEH